MLSLLSSTLKKKETMALSRRSSKRAGKTTPARKRSSRSPKSATAWHYRFPSSVKERREVEAKCGPRCFATHEDGRLIDPLCQYRSRRGGAKHVTCELDRAGCLAAERRERLNRNSKRLTSIRRSCRRLLVR